MSRYVDARDLQVSFHSYRSLFTHIGLFSLWYVDARDLHLWCLEYVWFPLCSCVWVSVCVCEWVSVHMCVSVCVCVCVCVCIYSYRPVSLYSKKGQICQKRPEFKNLSHTECIYGQICQYVSIQIREKTPVSENVKRGQICQKRPNMSKEASNKNVSHEDCKYGPNCQKWHVSKYVKKGLQKCRNFKKGQIFEKNMSVETCL